MSIRQADLGDLIDLTRIMAGFFARVGLENPEMHANFFYPYLCGTPNHICFVAGTPAVATICGVVGAHAMHGEITAHKTAWGSLPGKSGYGAALMRAFEAWAYSNGAERIIFTSRNHRTAKLLELRGYSRLETVHHKRFAND